jgi:dihydropteridine reductase
VLTGADGAMMKPTPDMIGYGLAKVATHHLATSLAAMVSKSSSSQQEAAAAANNGKLPVNSTVITILPKVIDTPNNRKYMPNSNFDEWSRPDDIADQIKVWSDDISKRPSNGSFVAMNTVNGKTKFVL